MIDSENNILDSNKLYYYNIIQDQHINRMHISVNHRFQIQ